MSSIVLFQQGNKSMHPNGVFYDPWESHIFDTIDQIRLWNPSILIYFIADKIEQSTANQLKKKNVIYVDIESLTLDRDISFLSNYFLGDKNPLWKTSLVRFFYIEQLIKKYDLNGVFTFDNDVLVYTDLNEIHTKIENKYANIAITKLDQHALICGMTWIKNANSIKLLNDSLIDVMQSPENLKMNECALLNESWKRCGDYLLGMLPIWFEGSYSDKCNEIGGFFDPATIGQFLGGTHNGHPKYYIVMHHELGPRIQRMINSHSHVIVKNKDQFNRYYYAFAESKNLEKQYKLYSMHVHSKKMKEFMSNA
jgi:hypothetical protein